MKSALDFPDLLRLIDERSTTVRTLIASAPSLDVQVPTCPEWTLFDLVRHLGQSRRFWAATVAAGPATHPRPRPSPGGPRRRPGSVRHCSLGPRRRPS